ncbi:MULTISPECIES: hypothetical protein [Pseudomonas]|uniref:hypothetical protein n=1 Tax=Pseudomonas TaxID=286 RepID=UPI0007109570|nr:MULTISPECIES: hypothetical protein [Pseudomonas]WIN08173.1 hypothetical protein QQF68_04785 [Pseudomonas syringae pv. antirrhini str. 126]
MSRTKFGPEYVPEPIGKDDPEFESFMSAALEGRPKLHFAPDLVAIYEAAKLGVTDPYSMDMTPPPADHGNDDKPTPSADTESMNEITREEFNAKLETIETKMDARVAEVSSKIDSFVAIQTERDKRMEATLEQISSNHGSIKSSIGSMKTTMIVTAVSTVLAIVIGVAGFNAMLTSNMVASFQMGRSEQVYQKNAEQPPPSTHAQPQQK